MADNSRLYQEEFLHEMKGLRDDIKGSLGDSQTMKKIIKSLEHHRGQDGENGISVESVRGEIKGVDAVFHFDMTDGSLISSTLKDFMPKDGYTPVKGKDYDDGIDGVTPRVIIGDVSVGDTPAIKNVGTELGVVLDFVLPKPLKGEKGDSIRGKAGDNGTNGRSFTWQGIYQAGKSYKKDDVVEFDGSSYIAVNDNANRNPTDVSYWNLMAKKGRDGISRGGGSIGGGSSSGVQSVVAGTNVTVDNTDPRNPIISSTGGGGGAVTSVAGKTGVVTLVKGDVGLDNVDNTSDATKNSATATLTNKDLTSGTNTFPTFNQSTTGSAATLTTARTIGTLTGDVTTVGSVFNGSANNSNATVLATVNANVGTFGSVSSVATQTVNAKGLTTAASNVAIQIAESQVTNLVSDLAAKQGTITLTTTGTSGASTLIGNTLNIPNYAGGGGSSGITRSILAITTTTTGAAVSLVDYVYYWTGSTPFTFTLPTAVSNTDRYTLKNSGTVNQTVNTTSSQTMDGNTSMIISPGSSREFISNNANWLVL